MLTERIVRDAKPDGKAHTVWDGNIAGFGMQITQSGKKNYVLRYTVAGRRRQAILARCSETSLKAAREMAGAELARIRNEGSGPLERRRNEQEQPTVGDGLRRFFDEYAPTRRSLGRIGFTTLRDYRNQARRYLEPALGSRNVADITRRHVEEMVKPIAPVQRNRVLALTSMLFNLFEVWQWRPQHTNPCRGVERAREEARNRVLSPAELAALSDALHNAKQRHPGPVAAIRFAAVTGLRIGEVLKIQWEHIDFEVGGLTIWGAGTGRGVQDLPTAALTILTRLPRINRWAFSTGRGRISYSHCRKTFAVVAEAAGLSDVRLHDLRRTFMTRAAMARAGAQGLRDLLGHKTTTMAIRYMRATGDPVGETRERSGATMSAMMGRDESR